MPATLFLQSEIQDPYKLYETLLNENPVHWDNKNNLWAIYCYKNCKAILNNCFAHIPPVNVDNKDGLNEYALLMTDQFVRLSNGINHQLAREAAILLLGKADTSMINAVIKNFFQKIEHKGEIDWVNSVCKKLPVLAVLKCFGFKDPDCEFIADSIEQLVKIMVPNKTPEQKRSINNVSKEIYLITEKHLLNQGIYKHVIIGLSEKYNIETDKIISLCISNLIGLSIIQGYDANRGLLSNSFLQILNYKNAFSNNVINREDLQKLIIETLRFDPPVHNTKRIAVDDIMLNNIVIKKGEIILIVLASANRDPKQFNSPCVFDINRTNNNEHLTFGAGAHACMARYFSVSLATETLLYFLERYTKIRLLEKDIGYEPMINARLAKKILISFS